MKLDSFNPKLKASVRRNQKNPGKKMREDIPLLVGMASFQVPLAVSFSRDFKKTFRDLNLLETEKFQKKKPQPGKFEENIEGLDC